MELSIKELVAVHVGYRDVFNAPVSIESLILWLGVTADNQVLFETAIRELKNERLIVESQGYLACYDKEGIILNQHSKAKLTKQIIEQGRIGMALLSKIPFVKFVGISGSIAAKNPTYNYNEKHVDLDLFIVTSKNTLWILVLIERLYTNFIRHLRGNHFYCLNFVTDESFLEIHNKNFYTATELVNLFPIMDEAVLSKLINCNLWIEKYYDKNSFKQISSNNQSGSFYSKLFAPLNYISFALFVFLRSIKRFDFTDLKNLNLSFEPERKCNLLRLSNERGGYQYEIKKRFVGLFKTNFKDYYSAELIEELFPTKYSFVTSPNSNIQDFNMTQLFRKYTLPANEKGTI